VKTKKRSFEVHLHTTQVKQNGVETEEGAIIHVYSSGNGCYHPQARNDGRRVLLIGL
jgi:hypothetical protein